MVLDHNLDEWLPYLIDKKDKHADAPLQVISMPFYLEENHKHYPAKIRTPRVHVVDTNGKSSHKWRPNASRRVAQIIHQLHDLVAKLFRGDALFL